MAQRLLLACGIAMLASGANPRAASAQGYGNIMITPKRVVLGGRERAAVVTLVNKGTQAATYRISFQDMRMTEAGKLEIIEQPGPDGMYAEKLIRYAPRQVVLDPGVAQTVRLLLRKPAGLEPGEYRSHLLFRAIPPEEGGQEIEALVLGEGEIDVRLIPLFGISIPVIVRHGELSASAALSDLALEPAAEPDEAPRLSLLLSRTGNRSLYGDFIVTLRSGGGEEQVGLLRGVALYTPNRGREVRLALSLPGGAPLHDGRLHVGYHASREEGGALLAEAEMPLEPVETTPDEKAPEAAPAAVIAEERLPEPDPEPIEVAAPPRRFVSGFRVQVCAMADSVNAELFAWKMRAEFDAPVHLEWVEPYYKVRLGDCVDREGAVTLMDRLVAAGHDEAWIVAATVPAPD